MGHSVEHLSIDGKKKEVKKRVHAKKEGSVRSGKGGESREENE